jgi:hypothetical protein
MMIKCTFIEFIRKFVLLKYAEKKIIKSLTGVDASAKAPPPSAVEKDAEEQAEEQAAKTLWTKSFQCDLTKLSSTLPCIATQNDHYYQYHKTKTADTITTPSLSHITVDSFNQKVYLHLSKLSTVPTESQFLTELGEFIDTIQSSDLVKILPIVKTVFQLDDLNDLTDFTRIKAALKNRRSIPESYPLLEKLLKKREYYLQVRKMRNVMLDMRKKGEGLASIFKKKSSRTSSENESILSSTYKLIHTLTTRTPSLIYYTVPDDDSQLNENKKYLTLHSQYSLSGENETTPPRIQNMYTLDNILPPSSSSSSKGEGVEGAHFLHQIKQYTNIYSIIHIILVQILSGFVIPDKGANDYTYDSKTLSTFAIQKLQNNKKLSEGGLQKIQEISSSVFSKSLKAPSTSSIQNDLQKELQKELQKDLEDQLGKKNILHKDDDVFSFLKSRPVRVVLNRFGYKDSNFKPDDMYYIEIRPIIKVIGVLISELEEDDTKPQYTYLSLQEKTCLTPDCETQPNYNVDGATTGLYCDTHKRDGMVNITSPSRAYEYGIQNYNGGEKWTPLSQLMDGAPPFEQNDTTYWYSYFRNINTIQLSLLSPKTAAIDSALNVLTNSRANTYRVHLIPPYKAYAICSQEQKKIHGYLPMVPLCVQKCDIMCNATSLSSVNVLNSTKITNKATYDEWERTATHNTNPQYMKDMKHCQQLNQYCTSEKVSGGIGQLDNLFASIHAVKSSIHTLKNTAEKKKTERNVNDSLLRSEHLNSLTTVVLYDILLNAIWYIIKIVIKHVKPDSTSTFPPNYIYNKISHSVVEALAIAHPQTPGRTRAWVALLHTTIVPVFKRILPHTSNNHERPPPSPNYINTIFERHKLIDTETISLNLSRVCVNPLNATANQMYDYILMQCNNTDGSKIDGKMFGGGGLRQLFRRKTSSLPSNTSPNLQGSVRLKLNMDTVMEHLITSFYTTYYYILQFMKYICRVCIITIQPENLHSNFSHAANELSKKATRLLELVKKTKKSTFTLSSRFTKKTPPVTEEVGVGVGDENDEENEGENEEKGENEENDVTGEMTLTFNRDDYLVIFKYMKAAINHLDRELVTARELALNTDEGRRMVEHHNMLKIEEAYPALIDAIEWWLVPKIRHLFPPKPKGGEPSRLRRSLISTPSHPYRRRTHKNPQRHVRNNTTHHIRAARRTLRRH